MKKYLKDNCKFLITILLIFLILNIRFPYYIDAPGGISNISDKIEIDGYKSKGSFNLAYVKEYRSTIPTLIFAFFDKDWKVLKEEEVMLDTENDNSYNLRDKLLMQESISNAIFVAYTKANKEIKLVSNKLLVTYISSNSNTDLIVGDQIIKVNNISVNSKKEVIDIIEKLSIGDKLNLIVKNSDKEYMKHAYIKDDNGNKKIGVLITDVQEYKTNPQVVIKTDSNESGSSGGLITALSMYNSLVPQDITHGLTIVGTGTIDKDGNVGSIGGVEYKLKSAVKNKANLFIVPNDENYDEAIKLKEKNNYNIDIIGVSTFDETIEYLNSLN